MGGRKSSRGLMLEDFQNVETLAAVKGLGLGNLAGAWNCPSIALGPRASLEVSGLWCSYLFHEKGPTWGVRGRIQLRPYKKPVAGAQEVTGRVSTAGPRGGIPAGRGLTTPLAPGCRC